MAWARANDGYTYVNLDNPEVTLGVEGSDTSWRVVVKVDGLTNRPLSGVVGSEALAVAEMDRLAAQLGYVS